MNDVANEVFDRIKELFEAQAEEQNVIIENLSDRVRRAEDIGWTRLGEMFKSENSTGLSLDELKNISKTLQDLTDTHPIFKRGAQLRNAYIFGRGVSFEDIGEKEKRVTRALEDPHNSQVVFGVEGYEIANKALFTSGIYTTLVNKGTRHFTVLPLSQISGVTTNPDDDMDIWFVQRSWGDNKIVWYPTSSVSDIPDYIETGGLRVDVDKNTVANIRHANRQAGWTFGLPDAFAALLWAKAYDAYLMDNAALVKSLSQIAWKITQPNKSAVTSAAARVQSSSGGVGGTAALANGDLQNVGVPSSQVNFNNGQPLAAMVASSFGVPVIALLSSPGATGGSYGAATTLDGPTIKGFETLQDTWAAYYNNLLRIIGSRSGHVKFSPIETDAAYRQITSIAQLVSLGIIYRDEARAMTMELMGVPKLHAGLPENPDITRAKIAQKYPASSGNSSDTVVSSQGVSSSLGATTNPQGDTNHDGDNE